MVTYLEAIISVLKDAGTPLNYGEIARRALERGLIPKTKSMRSNVSKIITTHMDPPDQIFVKVKRGIYALNLDYNNTPPKPPRPDPVPSGEYEELLYHTDHGPLIIGTVNQGTTFKFCAKHNKLLNFELIDQEISSALYALLDKNANTVYVGITRRGVRRIADHWRDKNFTHMAIIVDKVSWNTDLRTKIEGDLTKAFQSLSWQPTNRFHDIILVPRDRRTREDLLPTLKQITARVHSLIHNMASLYPDYATSPSIKSNVGKRNKKPVQTQNLSPKKPATPKFFTDPTIRHCWIWSCPRDIYEIAQSQEIWASKAPIESISARVRDRNLVTFYVKENKAFSDVYEFVGEWYRAPRIMWPDEIKKGSIIHTSQIRLRRMRDGRASLDPLKRRLGIFRKNTSGNAGHVLQSSGGYPGNHGRPIPESDMNIISESMRPAGTGQA